MTEIEKIEIILNHHAGNGRANNACHKVTSFLKQIQVNF